MSMSKLKNGQFLFNKEMQENQRKQDQRQFNQRKQSMNRIQGSTEKPGFRYTRVNKEIRRTRETVKETIDQ